MKLFAFAILPMLVLAPWATAAMPEGEAHLPRAVVMSEAGPRNQGWHFSVDGTWLYGPVEGYIETPSGGEPGTSSPDRPELDELGISRASMFSMELTAGWKNHNVYFKPQWIRLNGDDVLEEELISQGRVFPAGSSVDTEVKLDWYRFGYRYAFEFGQADLEERQFELGLSAGALLFDFDVQIDGEAGAFVDRAYRKIAPQFGVDLEWRTTDRFSVRGEVTSTIGLSSLPFVFTSQLTGRYELDGWARQDLTGIVGIGYEFIHFEDGQETSNDIEANFGPLLVLGLEFEF